jgi:pilus assembly protein CpaC
MRNLPVLALAVWATSIAPGHAAQMVTPGGAVPAGAAAAPAAEPRGPRMEGVAAISPAGAPILLEVGKGTLIRLPRPASTVFIANPDIADVQVKSPSLVYLSAKAPGETVVYAVDAGDAVLLNAPVRVEPDLSRLRQSLKALVPGQDIAVNSVQGSVVLSGGVANSGQAERARALATSIAARPSDVVNQLNVATPNQVNIRVRIAEVDRQAIKQMGINWSKASGNFQFNTSNSTTFSDFPSTNFISYAVDLPGNTARLNAELDALAAENFLTNLAEPNLTTVSGQPASFLAGGSFPVPTAAAAATAGGAPTITTTFKDYGVSLDVVPTIVDENHINLRVRPSVSQLTTTGAVSVPITASATVTIPALLVQQAETSVELASGQSFALAGLMQNNTEQDISKFPWLGDVPVIGALFRSDKFRRHETELVIIITPYLVKPSNTALAAPTDGYVAPHDVQRIVNGDLYRQSLPAAPAGRALIGPAGFRLD